jgi:hypothetical protein
MRKLTLAHTAAGEPPWVASAPTVATAIAASTTLTSPLQQVLQRAGAGAALAALESPSSTSALLFMEVLLLLSLGSVEPRRRVQEAAMEALDPAVISLREGGEPQPAVGRC